MTISGHLSVEVRDRFISCSNAREARHFQVIWLLAEGRRVAEVSQTTAFGARWTEQLAAR